MLFFSTSLLISTVFLFFFLKDPAPPDSYPFPPPDVLPIPAAPLTITAALGAGPTYSVGPISDLSGSCSGQNAEVEQTVDPSHAGQGRAMVSSRGGIIRP